MRTDRVAGKPRHPGRILLLACALSLLLAAAIPTAAFGFVTRDEIASLGPDGSPTSQFTGISELDLNQDTRGLYVVAAGPSPGIFGFDASSPPSFPTLPGFAPLPTSAPVESAGLAVDNTGLSTAGRIYYTPGGLGPDRKVYGFNSDGSPLGGSFPINTASNPGPPGGSSDYLCNVAVDSTGNLWVANYGLARLLEYSPSGTFIRSVSTSGQGTFPCNIAFDSNDNLYVGADSFPTWKYTFASDYATATQFDSRKSSAIAVDPATDHVFLAHLANGGQPEVAEFDAAGNFLSRFATNLSRIQGLAVDATSNYVYASNRQSGLVRVYGQPYVLPDLATTGVTALTNEAATLNGTVSAQGLALTDCHFEYVREADFEATGFADLGSGGSVPCNPAAGSIPVDSATHTVSAQATGLQRNTAYRFRLVAANTNGSTGSTDAGFQTTGPPIVETTGSPLRTATTARLDARMNPEGAASTYYFEYGDQGPCDANPCTATAPQSAGAGGEIVLVSQYLEGLEPGTTYHYRLVAENGNADGPAFGEDMTVTTFDSDEPLSHGHVAGPPGSDRAWEQVVPPDTGGNPADDAAAISDDGSRVVYKVKGGTPDSETGSFISSLFAERTATGWQTRKIFPTRAEAPESAWLPPGGKSDLSDFVLSNVPLSAHNGESSSWRLKPDGSPGKVYGAAREAFGGITFVSDDASRVVALLVGSHDPAHPSSATAEQLYDVSSGSPRLVSLLPDGNPPICGVSELPEPRRAQHWISPDGSLVFFPSRGNGSCSSTGETRNLYVRDLQAEATELISPTPLSGPDCDADFIKSTPDSVFFYTQSRLVAGDTIPSACGAAGGAGDNGDVYRYELAEETLQCVTCVAPGAAGVTFSINPQQVAQHIGVADDGSRVYFRSTRRLLPGAAAGGGIYRVMVDSGALVYVGKFDTFIGESSSSAISDDGAVVAFSADSPELDAIGGQQSGGEAQAYRYDDRDRSLVCVSCPIDGSAPAGPINRNLAGTVGINTDYINEDGSIFAFTTPTPLAAADQNTVSGAPDAGTDAYEFRDGRLLLLTDGLTNWPIGQGGSAEVPAIIGVTPSGNDVLFNAAAQYTPDALDGYSRLYDARIGGGFEFPPPPKPCPLEVCQGIPKGAPEEALPGTASLAGAGNAQAKKHTKKHIKKHHKKHKKKQTRKHRRHGKADSKGGRGR